MRNCLDWKVYGGPFGVETYISPKAWDVGGPFLCPIDVHDTPVKTGHAEVTVVAHPRQWPRWVACR